MGTEDETGTPASTTSEAQGQWMVMAAEVTELVLGRARLLLVPRGWTWSELARDRTGHAVELTSSRAVRFCLSGAVLRAAHELGLVEPREVYAGVEDGEQPVRLGPTRLAFAMLASASVIEAKRNALLTDYAWADTVAVDTSDETLWELAGRLWQADTEPTVFASTRHSLLTQLVWGMNDLTPHSKRRALAALDRALEATVALKAGLRRPAAPPDQPPAPGSAGAR